MAGVIPIARSGTMAAGPAAAAVSNPHTNKFQRLSASLAAGDPVPLKPGCPQELPLLLLRKLLLGSCGRNFASKVWRRAPNPTRRQISSKAYPRLGALLRAAAPPRHAARCPVRSSHYGLGPYSGGLLLTAGSRALIWRHAHVFPKTSQIRATGSRAPARGPDTHDGAM